MNFSTLQYLHGLLVEDVKRKTEILAHYRENLKACEAMDVTPENLKGAEEMTGAAAAAPWESPGMRQTPRSRPRSTGTAQ